MNTNDFSPKDIALVQRSVNERWKEKDVAVSQVDAEMRLEAEDRELTTYPALYWEQGDCHFMIVRIFGTQGQTHFQPQFFYRVHEHFGTGQRQYGDLRECVTTLLQVQSDHQRERTDNK